MTEEEIASSIAIIGMSGRFPLANNVEEFWENLCEGKEAISIFSKESLKEAGISEELIENPPYVRARGILADVEWFDADFFSMNAKEAKYTDPQHRLFLECSWEALENAGYCPDQCPGSVGVFGGCGMSFYLLNQLHPHLDSNTIDRYLVQIGNDKDFLTTRVSYKLNLKGPSLAIQTACSTSLVAVCTACNHLLTYQCDMALAGGASIYLPQKSGYLYSEGMILSPDGKCRPFDKEAQGTVMSNGVGVVVLKRLANAIEDKDHIYAVIRGFGLNNDGSRKVGFAAPSVEGQAEAIASAFSMAGIDPNTIGFVEAHGTGTMLGDPIEIKGLVQVFGKGDGKNQIAIGSLKSNIGHTVESAGVIGLIKTALSLYHRKIPPTIHFQKANPYIDFENTPFYVNTEIKEWEKQGFPRRACVSSFGVGGTNAHAILEEWQNVSSLEEDKEYFLVFSAKSLDALRKMGENLARYLQKHPEISLTDVAYTLQVGRKKFEHQRVLKYKNREEAINSLSSFDFHSPEQPLIVQGRRVPLPCYPFEKKRHWVETPQRQEKTAQLNADSTIEDTLVDIWKECLGIDSIGINDDFFEAGGDSLASVQVAALIQKKLGIGIAATRVLLEYRTIAKLSKFLLLQMPPTSSMIQLKKGEGTPLFVIHPIEGNLFPYLSFVNSLSCPNPVYGLVAEKELETIEETASFYIEEIKKKQEKGPYALFGYSFGGLIAYEMARILVAGGEKTALAMADIVRPDPTYLPISSAEALLLHLLELLNGQPLKEQELSDSRLIKSFHFENLPFEEQEFLLKRIKHHLNLLTQYRPKPYEGTILYFEAMDRFFKQKNLSWGSTWESLVSGEVTIHEIPGNHVTMMAPPQVEAIAHRLAEETF